MTTLRYYNGTDNTPKINVRDFQGKNVDFGTATRWIGTFNGTNSSNDFTVDTDTTAGAISGDSSGVITFTLQTLTIASDTYQIRLEVFDPAHTSGQYVAHECCGPYLSMVVC